MSRILITLTFLGASALVTPLAVSADSKAASPPNFLIVLADDLGYGDLACFGHSQIQSPHLDRFAREGIKLTNCYAAAANCSPSRTGLMTGRTPNRVGIHNWIPMFSPMHVRREEITIATLLGNAGYATCHVGKWHLNGRFNLPGQPQPGDHGFDYWFSTQNNALPTHHNPDNFVRNGAPVGKLEGYAAQLVADEAIHWLSDVRDKSRPFFLFVCFHEPHEPIDTDQRFSGLYDAPEGSTLPAHHGNVTQMDDAFGRILRSVDELGLRDETFVLFTSDNGPAITNRHPHGSAGPLRDKKGSMYEGGIRVPGIIRWPGHVQAGQVCDEPVCGVDLLPTLCEIAGVEKPSARALDGASLTPIFRGQPVERSQPLYWQFNVAHSAPKVALRDGDWKLLATLTGPTIKPFGDIRPEDQRNIKTADLDSFELYDLRNDIGETADLAAEQPQRVANMAAAMRRIYRNVQDESPEWPAWRWPRYEGQRINAFYRVQQQQSSQNK